MTDVFDQEAALAEALAKSAAQQAALREREKTHDYQFEAHVDCDDDGVETPTGLGHLWMTEVQTERAARLLTQRAKVFGVPDKLTPAQTGALVADAYLREFVRYRDSHDLIHRAAEHLRESPPLHRPDPAKLRMQPSIQLASGAYFNFLEPHTTPLSIEDMASGLSRICRYTGQLLIDENEVYTVAQHSVLASENCDPDCDPYEALMHDRAESVINDMASPLKQLLPCYKEIEARVEEATADYYGLPHEMSDACKRIDIRMLASEKQDLMPNVDGDDKWVLIEGVEPLPFQIECWTPAESRFRFLYRYHYLTTGKLPAPTEPFAWPHLNAPQDYVDALSAAWGFDCTRVRDIHLEIDFISRKLLAERIAGINETLTSMTKAA